MISRRHVLGGGVAVLLAGCASRESRAPVSRPNDATQDDATKGDTELGSLIRSAEFGAAAAVLQLEVDRFPLDRGRRLVLGQLHFGDRNLNAAIREFETIERRGGTKDDFRVIDLSEVAGIGFTEGDSFVLGSRFKDSASWLYLAALRQGQTAATPIAGPHESIRSLLRGETSVDEYVHVQWRMMNDVLTQFGREYAPVAGVSEMVAVGKRNLKAELTCVAHFALAEQAFGQNDARAAGRNFQTALTTEADRIVEFHIAKAELTRLSQPG